jgi:RimJ/RimL family protein N-acetyltransferase
VPRAVQEGILRRSVRRAGEYFDQVLWSMLKEDWGDHWVAIASRVH